MIRFSFKVIIALAGVEIEVKGLENIPEEPCLFIGNHRGIFDIVVTMLLIPHEVGYVGKMEFAKVPLMNYWMKMLNCVFLDRQDVRQGLKAIGEAADNVKAGTSMFIFPEGTRNHGEGIMEFKEGSLKIAEKASSAVVPVAITNTAEILEKHFPIVKAQHVRVSFGAPVYPKQLPREEKKNLGAKMRETVLEMFEAK